MEEINKFFSIIFIDLQAKSLKYPVVDHGRLMCRYFTTHGSSLTDMLLL